MINDLVKRIEEISNTVSSYSHPNNAARLYQVFQDLGTAVGKRMAELQQEDRNGNKDKKDNLS